mmetsp:Transcript_38293/g.94827  ORF Transcript_38293/g.94827 Transcript_38293/m.94827 type:complete len:207 (+) Transcript_38293:632-1252(+)
MTATSSSGRSSSIRYRVTASPLFVAPGAGLFSSRNHPLSESVVHPSVAASMAAANSRQPSMSRSEWAAVASNSSPPAAGAPAPLEEALSRLVIIIAALNSLNSVSEVSVSTHSALAGDICAASVVCLRKAGNRSRSLLMSTSVPATAALMCFSTSTWYLSCACVYSSLFSSASSNASQCAASHSRFHAANSADWSELPIVSSHARV